MGRGLLLSGLTESYFDLLEGRLVAPLGPDFITEFTYGYRLVWPAGRSLSRHMRQFSDWLLEENETRLNTASQLLGLKLDKQYTP